MADIVLAECRGQAWLVSGEQHIDDLLANTLPRHVSIELVACESKTEVDALWVQLSRPQEGETTPWLIHPGVANRVRRTEGRHAVFFAQWSALLDEDAKSVTKAAAIWVGENPDCRIAIVRYLKPDAPAAYADLANLRASLIEAELATFGITGDRIDRETRGVDGVPGMGEESQRLDIEVKPQA